MSDGNWSESSVQSGKLPKSSAGGSFMKGGGKKPVSGSASSWANSQSGGGQVAKSSRFENWVKAETESPAALLRYCGPRTTCQRTNLDRPGAAKDRTAGDKKAKQPEQYEVEFDATAEIEGGFRLVRLERVRPSLQSMSTVKRPLVTFYASRCWGMYGRDQIHTLVWADEAKVGEQRVPERQNQSGKSSGDGSGYASALNNFSKGRL